MTMIANSEFKPIPGFSDYYVSKLGVIKGKRCNVLKPALDKRGYKKVWVYSNGKRKELYTHRVVALAFIAGDCSLTVNHIDGNKLNNSVSNLEWCTNTYNMQHSFNAGLRDTSKTWKTRKQINNGLWSANSARQRSICADFINLKLPRIALAKKYNISRHTVTKILKLHEVV